MRYPRLCKAVFSNWGAISHLPQTITAVTKLNMRIYVLLQKQKGGDIFELDVNKTMAALCQGFWQFSCGSYMDCLDPDFWARKVLEYLIAERRNGRQKQLLTARDSAAMANKVATYILYNVIRFQNHFINWHLRSSYCAPRSDVYQHQLCN